MYEDLDKYQISVLEVIKQDGTLTGAQIGAKIWMSKTAVQRNVRVLREKGYIHSAVCALRRSRMRFRTAVMRSKTAACFG